MILITPLLDYSVTPDSLLAEMWQSVAPVYPLLGLCGGYALVMFFNPLRQTLGDGFRCIGRYKRIWLTFALLGFGYFVFQFATFTPIRNWADLDPNQVVSLPNWYWPRFVEIWRETPLPALEGVAGIFDNDRLWSYFIYVILLLSALASLFKPIVFWRLPEWSGLVSAAGLLRISATVDTVAFIFEYLFGVYIQVYLITVCLAWIKGVSFEEGELFRFAMRRFSYVLEWAGIVVVVSTLVVRLPLLLAYFTNIPGVLDYLPIERVFMSGLIIAFCSVQISLALHNETLSDAIRAHGRFILENAGRFAWFLIICGIHFLGIMICDAIARSAIADRLGALFIWKFIFACLRGIVTGWLLASWVCLFRQCESGRANQEKWIQY